MRRVEVARRLGSIRWLADYARELEPVQIESARRPRVTANWGWQRVIRPVLLALWAFLVTAVGAAAEDLAGSSWQNQRGSVLAIATVDAMGTFKGTFEMGPAGFECEGKFDAAGTIRKTQIIFYVTFKNAARDCHILTIWRGSVRGSRLSALWDIAFATRKIGRLRFLKGRDVFKRM